LQSKQGLRKRNGMSERIERSETIGTLAAALVKVQASLEPVKREAENPFFHSRYADLLSIIEEARPKLAANGIAFLQLPGETKELGKITETDEDGSVAEVLIGAMALTTMLLHESGEFIASTLSLPYRMKDPQAGGSAMSYARRYGLQSALGIAAEDDDGNAAAGRKPTSASADQGREASPGLCPAHGKPFTKGKFGWYCKTKVGDTAEGKPIWCKCKPAVVPAAKPDPDAGEQPGEGFFDEEAGGEPVRDVDKESAGPSAEEALTIVALCKSLEKRLPKPAERLAFARGWCDGHSVSPVPRNLDQIKALGVDALNGMLDALKLQEA
jgi:hypothetical protein